MFSSFRVISYSEFQTSSSGRYSLEEDDCNSGKLLARGVIDFLTPVSFISPYVFKEKANSEDRTSLRVSKS